MKTDTINDPTDTLTDATYTQWTEADLELLASLSSTLILDAQINTAVEYPDLAAFLTAGVWQEKDMGSNE